MGSVRRIFWSRCCPFALILVGVLTSLTGIRDVFRDSSSVDWVRVMLGVPWLVIGVVLALLLPGALRKNPNKAMDGIGE